MTGKRSDFGFTLIEMLVVLAIVATLLTLALPRYFGSVDRAKESVLRENLHIIRESIDKFYGDNGRYPNDLAELVDKHYLRSLPVDPVTESNQSWVAIAPPVTERGSLADVKSGAVGSSKGGSNYADW